MTGQTATKRISTPIYCLTCPRAQNMSLLLLVCRKLSASTGLSSSERLTFREHSRTGDLCGVVVANRAELDVADVENGGQRRPQIVQVLQTVTKHTTMHRATPTTHHRLYVISARGDKRTLYVHVRGLSDKSCDSDIRALRILILSSLL